MYFLFTVLCAEEPPKIWADKVDHFSYLNVELRIFSENSRKFQFCHCQFCTEMKLLNYVQVLVLLQSMGLIIMRTAFME